MGIRVWWWCFGNSLMMVIGDWWLVWWLALKVIGDWRWLPFQLWPLSAARAGHPACRSCYSETDHISEISKQNQSKFHSCKKEINQKTESINPKKFIKCMEKSNCYLLKAISKLRNCLHLLTKLLLVDVGNHLIWKLAIICIVLVTQILEMT